jgi:hypothetical protein
MSVLLTLFFVFSLSSKAADMTALDCSGKQINDCMRSLVSKVNELVKENNELKKKLSATSILSVSPDNLTNTPADDTWRNIDGMQIEFDLSMPSKVLMIYSMTLSAIGTAVGGWVGTRLLIDGVPLLTSGRHTQPQPSDPLKDSTDMTFGAQDLSRLTIGHHKIQLQWRAYGCQWNSYASYWYAAYGGIGGRTLSAVILPE